MKIRGRVVPKELKVYFFTVLIMNLIGFSVLIPVLVYIVGPFVLWFTHDVPISISISRAIGFDKIYKLVLFASVWISIVLWVSELIAWYRKPDDWNKKVHGQPPEKLAKTFHRWQAKKRNKNNHKPE